MAAIPGLATGAGTSVLEDPSEQPMDLRPDFVQQKGVVQPLPVGLPYNLDLYRKMNADSFAMIDSLPGTRKAQAFADTVINDAQETSDSESKVYRGFWSRFIDALPTDYTRFIAQEIPEAITTKAVSSRTMHTLLSVVRNSDMDEDSASSILSADNTMNFLEGHADYLDNNVYEWWRQIQGQPEIGAGLVGVATLASSQTAKIPAMWRRFIGITPTPAKLTGHLQTAKEAQEAAAKQGVHIGPRMTEAIAKGLEHIPFVGKALSKNATKVLAKKLPIAATIFGFVFGVQRGMRGEIIRGGGEIASGILSDIGAFATATTGFGGWPFYAASLGIDAALIAADAIDEEGEPTQMAAEKFLSKTATGAMHTGGLGKTVASLFSGLYWIKERLLTKNPLQSQPFAYDGEIEDIIADLGEENAKRFIYARTLTSLATECQRLRVLDNSLPTYRQERSAILKRMQGIVGGLATIDERLSGRSWGIDMTNDITAQILDKAGFATNRIKEAVTRKSVMQQRADQLRKKYNVLGSDDLVVKAYDTARQEAMQSLLANYYGNNTESLNGEYVKNRQKVEGLIDVIIPNILRQHLNTRNNADLIQKENIVKGTLSSTFTDELTATRQDVTSATDKYIDDRATDMAQRMATELLRAQFRNAFVNGSVPNNENEYLAKRIQIGIEQVKPQCIAFVKDLLEKQTSAAGAIAPDDADNFVIAKKAFPTLNLFGLTLEDDNIISATNAKLYRETVQPTIDDIIRRPRQRLLNPIYEGTLDGTPFAQGQLQADTISDMARLSDDALSVLNDNLEYAYKERSSRLSELQDGDAPKVDIDHAEFSKYRTALTINWLRDLAYLRRVWNGSQEPAPIVVHKEDFPKWLDAQWENYKDDTILGNLFFVRRPTKANAASNILKNEVAEINRLRIIRDGFRSKGDKSTADWIDERIDWYSMAAQNASLVSSIARYKYDTLPMAMQVLAETPFDTMQNFLPAILNTAVGKSLDHAAAALIRSAGKPDPQSVQFFLHHYLTRRADSYKRSDTFWKPVIGNLFGAGQDMYYHYATPMSEAASRLAIDKTTLAVKLPDGTYMHEPVGAILEKAAANGAYTPEQAYAGMAAIARYLQEQGQPDVGKGLFRIIALPVAKVLGAMQSRDFIDYLNKPHWFDNRQNLTGVKAFLSALLNPNTDVLADTTPRLLDVSMTLSQMADAGARPTAERMQAIRNELEEAYNRLGSLPLPTPLRARLMRRLSRGFMRVAEMKNKAFAREMWDQWAINAQSIWHDSALRTESVANIRKSIDEALHQARVVDDAAAATRQTMLGILGLCNAVGKEITPAEMNVAVRAGRRAMIDLINNAFDISAVRHIEDVAEKEGIGMPMVFYKKVRRASEALEDMLADINKASDLMDTTTSMTERAALSGRLFALHVAKDAMSQPLAEASVHLSSLASILGRIRDTADNLVKLKPEHKSIWLSYLKAGMHSSGEIADQLARLGKLYIDSATDIAANRKNLIRSLVDIAALFPTNITMHEYTGLLRTPRQFEAALRTFAHFFLDEAIANPSETNNLAKHIASKATMRGDYIKINDVNTASEMMMDILYHAMFGNRVNVRGLRDELDSLINNAEPIFEALENGARHDSPAVQQRIKEFKESVYNTIVRDSHKIRFEDQTLFLTQIFNRDAGKIRVWFSDKFDSLPDAPLFLTRDIIQLIRNDASGLAPVYGATKALPQMTMNELANLHAYLETVVPDGDDYKAVTTWLNAKNKHIRGIGKPRNAQPINITKKTPGFVIQNCVYDPQGRLVDVGFGMPTRQTLERQNDATRLLDLRAQGIRFQRAGQDLDETNAPVIRAHNVPSSINEQARHKILNDIKAQGEHPFFQFGVSDCTIYSVKNDITVIHPDGVKEALHDFIARDAAAPGVKPGEYTYDMLMKETDHKLKKLASTYWSASVRATQYDRIHAKSIHDYVGEKFKDYFAHKLPVVETTEVTGRIANRLVENKVRAKDEAHALVAVWAANANTGEWDLPGLYAMLENENVRTAVFDVIDYYAARAQRTNIRLLEVLQDAVTMRQLREDYPDIVQAWNKRGPSADLNILVLDNAMYKKFLSMAMTWMRENLGRHTWNTGEIQAAEAAKHIYDGVAIAHPVPLAEAAHSIGVTPATDHLKAKFHNSTPGHQIAAKSLIDKPKSKREVEFINAALKALGIKNSAGNIAEFGKDYHYILFEPNFRVYSSQLAESKDKITKELAGKMILSPGSLRHLNDNHYTIHPVNIGGIQLFEYSTGNKLGAKTRAAKPRQTFDKMLPKFNRSVGVTQTRDNPLIDENVSALNDAITAMPNDADTNRFLARLSIGLEHESELPGQVVDQEQKQLNERLLYNIVYILDKLQKGINGNDVQNNALWEFIRDYTKRVRLITQITANEAERGRLIAEAGRATIINQFLPTYTRNATADEIELEGAFLEEVIQELCGDSPHRYSDFLSWLSASRAVLASLEQEIVDGAPTGQVLAPSISNSRLSHDAVRKLIAMYDDASTKAEGFSAYVSPDYHLFGAAAAHGGQLSPEATKEIQPLRIFEASFPSHYLGENGVFSNAEQMMLVGHPSYAKDTTTIADRRRTHNGNTIVVSAAWARQGEDDYDGDVESALTSRKRNRQWDPDTVKYFRDLTLGTPVRVRITDIVNIIRRFGATQKERQETLANADSRTKVIAALEKTTGKDYQTVLDQINALIQYPDDSPWVKLAAVARNTADSELEALLVKGRTAAPLTPREAFISAGSRTTSVGKVENDIIRMNAIMNLAYSMAEIPEVREMFSDTTHIEAHLTSNELKKYRRMFSDVIPGLDRTRFNQHISSELPPNTYSEEEAPMVRLFEKYTHIAKEQLQLGIDTGYDSLPLFTLLNTEGKLIKRLVSDDVDTDMSATERALFELMMRCVIADTMIERETTAISKMPESISIKTRPHRVFQNIIYNQPFGDYEDRFAHMFRELPKDGTIPRHIQLLYGDHMPPQYNRITQAGNPARELHLYNSWRREVEEQLATHPVLAASPRTRNKRFKFYLNYSDNQLASIYDDAPIFAQMYQTGANEASIPINTMAALVGDHATYIGTHGLIADNDADRSKHGLAYLLMKLRSTPFSQRNKMETLYDSLRETYNAETAALNNRFGRSNMSGDNPYGPTGRKDGDVYLTTRLQGNKLYIIAEHGVQDMSIDGQNARRAATDALAEYWRLLKETIAARKDPSAAASRLGWILGNLYANWSDAEDLVQNELKQIPMMGRSINVDAVRAALKRFINVTGNKQEEQRILQLIDAAADGYSNQYTAVERASIRRILQDLLYMIMNDFAVAGDTAVVRNIIFGLEAGESGTRMLNKKFVTVVAMTEKDTSLIQTRQMLRRRTGKMTATDWQDLKARLSKIDGYVPEESIPTTETDYIGLFAPPSSFISETLPAMYDRDLFNALTANRVRTQNAIKVRTDAVRTPTEYRQREAAAGIVGDIFGGKDIDTVLQMADAQDQIYKLAEASVTESQGMPLTLHQLDPRVQLARRIHRAAMRHITSTKTEDNQIRKSVSRIMQRYVDPDQLSKLPLYINKLVNGIRYYKQFMLGLLGAGLRFTTFNAIENVTKAFLNNLEDNLSGQSVRFTDTIPGGRYWRCGTVDDMWLGILAQGVEREQYDKINPAQLDFLLRTNKGMNIFDRYAAGRSIYHVTEPGRSWFAKIVNSYNYMQSKYLNWVGDTFETSFREALFTKEFLKNHNLLHSMPYTPADMMREAARMSYKTIDDTYFDYANKVNFLSGLGTFFFPFGDWAMLNTKYWANAFASNPMLGRYVSKYYAGMGYSKGRDSRNRMINLPMTDMYINPFSCMSFNDFLKHFGAKPYFDVQQKAKLETIYQKIKDWPKEQQQAYAFRTKQGPEIMDYIEFKNLEPLGHIARFADDWLGVSPMVAGPANLAASVFDAKLFESKEYRGYHGALLNLVDAWWPKHNELQPIALIRILNPAYAKYQEERGQKTIDKLVKTMNMSPEQAAGYVAFVERWRAFLAFITGAFPNHIPEHFAQYGQAIAGATRKAKPIIDDTTALNDYLVTSELPDRAAYSLFIATAAKHEADDSNDITIVPVRDMGDLKFVPLRDSKSEDEKAVFAHVAIAQNPLYLSDYTKIADAKALAEDQYNAYAVNALGMIKREKVREFALRRGINSPQLSDAWREYFRNHYYTKLKSFIEFVRAETSTNVFELAKEDLVDDLREVDRFEAYLRNVTRIGETELSYVKAHYPKFVREYAASLYVQDSWQQINWLSPSASAQTGLEYLDVKSDVAEKLAGWRLAIDHINEIRELATFSDPTDFNTTQFAPGKVEATDKKLLDDLRSIDSSFDKRVKMGGDYHQQILQQSNLAPVEKRQSEPLPKELYDLAHYPSRKLVQALSQQSIDWINSHGMVNAYNRTLRTGVPSFISDELKRYRSTAIET